MEFVVYRIDDDDDDDDHRHDEDSQRNISPLDAVKILQFRILLLLQSLLGVHNFLSKL